jgi:glycosyltransferase involved in cell wall biosynthesis
LRKAAKAAEYLVNGVGLHQSLRTASPDLVHFQWLPFAEELPSLEIFNLKWTKTTGAGVVYTIHNVLPHDTGKRHQETFQRIYQIPDALICHTHQAKNELVKDFELPSNKVWMIPHGPLADAIAFVPQEEARRQLHLDLKMSLCLLFGFIRPYKGVEFMIDSWKRVKDKEPSARLVLAGQPEEGYGEVLSDKIEALGLEREIDTRFEFLPQEKLNLYIHAADVLIYPYRDITQSGALLTGLTTGKPIVATNVGGFSEMIQHDQTGVLVEYGDEEQLTRELVQLLRDAERRERLGRAAQDMVETKYSWKAIARKTVECYQSVIN